jgi:hypothetical protein
MGDNVERAYRFYALVIGLGLARHNLSQCLDIRPGVSMPS